MVEGMEAEARELSREVEGLIQGVRKVRGPGCFVAS